jgi:colanic acid biosynthesis glycosyl transferase WcaI
LLAHRTDITFVISGDGVMRPDIEAACKGLGNVRLLPLQPIERLNDLLGLADIHLLPQSPEAEDLVLPSKLTGMVSSGRPIIATCRESSEIAHVVKQCGVVVPPEDPSALAQAIDLLSKQPEQRLEMGAQARRYADEHLAKQTILRHLVEQFHDLLPGHGRPDAPRGV